MDGSWSAEREPRGPHRRRRWTRRGRFVIWTMTVVLASAVATIGWRSLPGTPVARSVNRSAPVQGAGLLGAGPAAPQEPGTEAFARARDVILYLPAHRLVALAYHEASSDSAFRLRPRGTCVRNANRWKFTTPRPSAGPEYVVMSSRGRPHPATSAVDVAMVAGTDVLSPVSGVVGSVRRYRLYGVYRDIRLSLIPDRDADLRVVLIHLTGVRVREGATVVAGVTRIGSPRVFPFRSQVNDYVGSGVPHIHLEVKERGG